jgi:aminoglycoside 3-N-acetyltransferase I
MKIKKLESGEVGSFEELIEIFREVFENDFKTPSREHLSKLLKNPDFMVFAAELNGKIVGGLTVYVLHQYYNPKPLAYIYDVGVSPSFQGQGVGKKLMKEVCDYCKANGFDAAYVEAELDDNEAINFYRKTQATHELKALHFTYTFDA